ncbi:MULTISPECIES: hypothetical protein [Acinetobacter calcoaceticus/baumannii complex]|uniref:hypothetical protein n=1 Tax=Acinetobacter calcoaceticus/baumannii complex TaxID=909768 RepID=UPI000680470D|nr:MULTISPECIES: hypothetical protein [Acinetobacter calcoaceticus/baumannii complex]
MAINETDFRSFVDSMSPEELRKYAEKVGTTDKYIIKKLRFRYSMPTIKLIESLALASNGKLKKENLLLWFAGYTLPKSLVQKHD